MDKVFQNVIVSLLCIFFIVLPLIPDVQISRPKLLTIEVISYIILCIVLIYNIFSERVLYRKNNFLYFSLLFLGLIIIRYLISTEKAVAYSELKRWFVSVWILYVISIVESRYYPVLIKSFIFGSFLSVLYGMLQYTGGFWIIEVPKMSRVMSMFGNPIFFAVHIVNLLPLIFSRIMLEKKLVSRLVYAGMFIICLIVLYYTKTRAAWIGFFVATLFFIYFALYKKQKIVYLILCFIGFTVFVYFTRNVWLRQQAHLLIWRDSLRMWLDYPFFGIGLGNFHIRFVDYASGQLRKIWPQKQFIINDAHNEYIQLLVENGVIGFTIFSISLYLLFREAIYYVRHRDKGINENKVIILCLICGILGVLIQNFFSVDLRFTISSVYLYITAGFIIGYTSSMAQFKLGIFKLRLVKFVAGIIICFLLGILTYSKKTLSILSLIHISNNGIKFYISDAGSGLLQLMFRPYLASYKLQKEKDFFDEKIVDAAKTLQELELLKQKYPDKSIIYERIAWIYAKERIFDKAIENYLTAIRLNPNSFAAYNNLGNIMFLIGDRNKAIEFYTRSIEINPRQVDARVNLGILYYYEGKLNLAAEQFSEVLKLDPTNEKAMVYLKKMRE
ncbi:MAG: tetratricopeptide repeat protein [Endomicrobia bacterium]|nr:tetratricopeptide repeat protein [Endomicrobiia bacterium]